MVASSSDTNGRTGNGPASPGARSPSEQSATTRGQQTSTATHPVEPLLEQIAIVREFALHYVEAQKDLLRSAIRRAVLKILVATVAAVVGITFVVACTIMLAEGLAELISIAAGDRAWVGNLAVGGGVLLMLAVIVISYVTRQLRAAREQTIRKYESRHHAQRAKFGADVRQREAT
jgi:hypothetical protein